MLNVEHKLGLNSYRGLNAFDSVKSGFVLVV